MNLIVAIPQAVLSSSRDPLDKHVLDAKLLADP